MASNDLAATATKGATGAKKGRTRPRIVKKHPVSKQGGAADTTGSKKNRTAKKSHITYKTYIYKVLKQIHPKVSASASAMSIMNSFMVDILEKIASEAGSLACYNKKPTVSLHEIQTAVKLVLPGELAKHAVLAGAQAVTRFMEY